MAIIFNDTILKSGKYVGQKAGSVFKFDPDYFNELEKAGVKMFVLPDNIKTEADINFTQESNRSNWKGDFAYSESSIFRYWESVRARFKRMMKEIHVFKQENNLFTGTI